MSSNSGYEPDCVLREIQLLVMAARDPSSKWTDYHTRVHCPDSVFILQRLASGESLTRAFVDCLGNPESELRTIFFGPVAADIICIDSGKAHATDGLHTLIVCLIHGADTGAAEAFSSQPAPSDQIVVLKTDFTRFQFDYSTGDHATSETFSTLDVDEMTADVRLVGSVWESVFPTHRAIITRTLAISLSKLERGPLFEESSSRLGQSRLMQGDGARSEQHREKRALANLIAALCLGASEGHNSGRPVRLLSLYDMNQRLMESGDEQIVGTQRVVGDLVFRSYGVPFSKLVRFDPSAVAQMPSRGDYVLSYLPCNDGPEFHREFAMSLEEWQSQEQEVYRALCDILHALAIRRSGLFRIGFAHRVYTILLSPALCESQLHADRGLLLVPCLILYRVPGKSIFRSTFTISYIAVPVGLEPSVNGKDGAPSLARIIGPRIASIDELRALRIDLRSQVAPSQSGARGTEFRVQGPLAELLSVVGDTMSIPSLLQRTNEWLLNKLLRSSPQYHTHAAPRKVVSLLELRDCLRDFVKQSLPNARARTTNAVSRVKVPPLAVILRSVAAGIWGQWSKGRSPSSSARASAIHLAATVESTLSTLLLQVNWKPPHQAAQPWENWLITGEDRAFSDNVYKLMFYEDYLQPRSGYTSRRGIDLRRMLVGNSLRTDMNGMTFFDPTDELKLILYPLHREKYPNYSIVRWMAFSLYSESALCSLQGMIQRFYVDLHGIDDLRRVVETLSEMTESFAELYDLDIRRYLYRREYARLRRLLNVDRDYAFLVDKLGSVKEDASLREQRLFNKLLFAFTIATTSVAIIGTVAQVRQWTTMRIVLISVPTALVLTIAGYAAFDRVRRLFARRH